jgi:acyl carrier protein
MATIDTIKDVLEQSADVDRDEVTPDTTFDSLMIDSLDMTTIVCDLEEAFDIELENLDGVSTVGELVQLVEELQ